MPVGEAIARLRDQGVRRFVYTNIDRDGMLDGPDLDEARAVAEAAGAGAWSSRAASARSSTCTRSPRCQLDGVIVGKALYERRFTVAEALAALAG